MQENVLYTQKLFTTSTWFHTTKTRTRWWIPSPASLSCPWAWANKNKTELSTLCFPNLIIRFNKVTFCSQIFSKGKADKVNLSYNAAYFYSENLKRINFQKKPVDMCLFQILLVINLYYLCGMIFRMYSSELIFNSAEIAVRWRI